MILKEENYRRFIDTFNRQDVFEGNAGISNDDAWEYLSSHMPLFDCPDRDFLITYYFRYWSYRKHIHNTPTGRVVTEFLPEVSWAGKYNAIVMPAAFHIDEGRWLRNETLCEEYLNYWYGGEANTHDYSTALPAAALDLCRVTGRCDAVLSLYEKIKDELAVWENGFEKDYGTWIKGRYWGIEYIGQCENGLFRITDDMEGSEFSAGKNGYRPLVNCCMYASYQAVAEMADMLGNAADAEIYRQKGETLRGLILDLLWNPKENFFTPLWTDGTHSDARELYGFTPWMFRIAEKKHEKAWLALREAGGFVAPAATPFLATSHKDFEILYEGHMCRWNGPSWPLGTSFMLKSLITLLQTPGEHCVDKTDFFRYLSQYVRSQRLVTDSGEIVPWIDEDQNPFTGEWIARAMLNRERESYRGKDYNHSSMNDLIITGLCGIMPSFGDLLEINPLLPEGVWDYFCLDKIQYHGYELTLLYDKTGMKYGKGKGFFVFVNGEEKARSEKLSPLHVKL